MFVKTDFLKKRLISLVRIQLYFCAFFLSLFIVTSDMYFYPMNSDFLSLWLEFSKRTPTTYTFVPQEQGRFTESATGLIVCVFQACGGNGEGALSVRKRKKCPLCRRKGGRSRRCGFNIAYNITSLHVNQGWVRNNDLMGAASEEPTFTEVQSHRK